MKLSPAQVHHFYELMWPLQYFVKQQLHLAPHIDSYEAYVASTIEEKLEVRNALYVHGYLIKKFVAENPTRLSNSSLETVDLWQHFVMDDFYIERFLKKGAILINSEAKARVFQVLGLHDALEETFMGYPTPIRIHTVLLPYQEQIVYDGLINLYNVFFGSGVAADLREIYMAAKQNGRLLTTLNPNAPPAKTKPLPKNWQPLTTEIHQLATKLKSSRQAPVQSQAIKLLKLTAELAETAVADPTDLEALWKLQEKLERTLEQMENILHRANW